VGKKEGEMGEYAKKRTAIGRYIKKIGD